MNKISVMECWEFNLVIFKKSFLAFKKNWMVLVYAIAVTFLTGTLLSAVFNVNDLKAGGLKTTEAMTLITAYYVLKYLIQSVFNIGQTKISIDIVNGKKTRYSDLFKTQGVFLKFLLVSILYELTIIGGLILFILPGIYVALRYCFAPILIIDKKMGVAEAFEKSKEMTDGRKLEMIIFFLTSILFIASGLVVFIVGVVVTFGIYELAFIYFYKHLLRESDIEEEGGQMEFEDIQIPTK
jgi:hypothetical protein